MSDTKLVDIGIVIALEEELSQILPQLKYESKWDEEWEEYFYSFTIGLGNRSYECVAVLVGGMGPEKAALYCERLITARNPATLVNIGIAGALSNDVNICDVVVGSQVDGYHQDGRFSESEDGEFKFETSREVLKTTSKYPKHTQNFKHAHKDEMESWSSAAKERWETLISNDDQEYLNMISISGADPSLHTGHIASGPIVGASKKFAAWLLSLDRKYLALEMEAYGVMQSAFDKENNTLVIRGISDFSDERKKLIDDIGGGSIRKIAMQNAFSFLNAPADTCLFDYNSNSPKRPKWKLILDATLESKMQCDAIIAEVSKLNYGDLSIQIESVQEGSIIINASSAPAVSERMQALIGLGMISEIKGVDIKDFKTESAFSIDSSVAESREILLEKDNYKNPDSLSDLSMFYFKRGEFDVSRVIQEKLLYLQSSDGNLSLKAIDTLNNLAQSYRRLGDFAEAKRLIDVAIKEYLLMNGSKDIQLATLIARNNRAELLIALGRPEEALVEAREVFNKQLSILGPSHKNILQTKNNLAEALRLTGQIENALRLHYENLKARLQNSNIRDSDTNVSAWNLLLCYVDLGHVDEVGELLDQLSWLVDTDPMELSVEQRDLRKLVIKFKNIQDFRF